MALMHRCDRCNDDYEACEYHLGDFGVFETTKDNGEVGAYGNMLRLCPTCRGELKQWMEQPRGE